MTNTFSSETSDVLVWSTRTSRYHATDSVAHCRNDQDYRMYLFFSLIRDQKTTPYGYMEESFRLYCTCSLFNSFNDYEQWTKYRLGEFTTLNGAKQYAFYVLEGWQESTTFNHCPSIEACVGDEE